MVSAGMYLISLSAYPSGVGCAPPPAGGAIGGTAPATPTPSAADLRPKSLRAGGGAPAASVFTCAQLSMSARVTIVRFTVGEPGAQPRVARPSKQPI
jgi:hypothetical protein